VNAANKKTIIRTISTIISGSLIFIIVVLHNAWGDDRYELKDEAIRKEIIRLDTALIVTDQEILFAESERQKAKFIAIKAIYERQKEALREKLNDE